MSRLNGISISSQLGAWSAGLGGGVLLGALMVGGLAWPVGAQPLQKFRCNGLIRHLEIFEDATRPGGRRLFQEFSDGSSGNMFATRVQRRGHVAYVTRDGSGEEARYFPGSGRMEFWDREGRIEATIFGECQSYGAARKAAGARTEAERRRFTCSAEYVRTVELIKLDATTIQLHHVYSDGTTEDELFEHVKDGDEFTTYQTRNDRARQAKAGSPGWLPGYIAAHMKYFPKKEILQFWSQSGPKNGKPATMYNECK